jgi:hypothetical protein
MTCTHRAIRSWSEIDGSPVPMWTCVDCGAHFDPRIDNTEHSTKHSADSTETFCKQEPVAWMHTNAVGERYFRKKPHDKVFNPQPVYVHPERRPLTDAEIKSIVEKCGIDTQFIPHTCALIARAIEEAHDIKGEA